MTWQTIPDAGPLIVAALTAAGRELSIRAIAARIGRSASYTARAVYLLRDAGIVTRVLRKAAGGGWCWKLTGEPLPATFAAADTGTASIASRYDHRPLAAVLGMDVTPAAAANVRVHLCEGGR